MIKPRLSSVGFASLLASVAALAEPAEPPAPAHLAGELPASQILDGAYPWPSSPAPDLTPDLRGFAAERLSRVPAPGVHPRILFSPEDLPDLRRRLRESAHGRAMLATLRDRLAGTIDRPGTWESEVLARLATGDSTGALEILQRNPKPTTAAGHYQPHLPYLLVMAALDALIRDDASRGRVIAAAIAAYARMVAPFLENCLRQPLHDDVWRIKAAGSATGRWTDSQGARELLAYHLIGYAYDFAALHMDEAQRDVVRSLVARMTHGRVWLGARLPHHFRNWNWVAVGLSQPLLALAIEGEDGYDPRVYRLGVEIARDYLTHGISPAGSSTEAVGYTQFGLVWGNPFFVAAARRGDNLLAHPHHRAMLDWYLQTMEPFAAEATKALADETEIRGRGLSPLWTSHGDGGREGPSVPTMMMWKRFYPDDPRIDLLLRIVTASSGLLTPGGRYHLIESLLWASEPRPASPDPQAELAAAAGAARAPLTWFDPARGSLIARNAWLPDPAVAQFECRTDSVGPSHEHADRGNFTFSALGRSWAQESFRSIETRHHNNVLVDGQGQGYWPGPGRWLGHVDGGWAVLAACDAKEAYDWFWPKQILTEDPATFGRFLHPRWSSYGEEAAIFQKAYAGFRGEPDSRAPVVEFFRGFEQGDPRLWDEDAWPVRFPHNPVQRAFRTLAFVRGPQPWLLIVDDIQKDERERLYEWLMLPGVNTELASIAGNDLVLCDASAPRGPDGSARPARGDRALLVRVLEAVQPDAVQGYQGRPSFRLESFEKKDTTSVDGRSFGLDKRLVIASRAIAPRFKILLFPHRIGDALPRTEWTGNRTELTISTAAGAETISFAPGPDGRTRVALARAGNSVALP